MVEEACRDNLSCPDVLSFCELTSGGIAAHNHVIGGTAACKHELGGLAACIDTFRKLAAGPLSSLDLAALPLVGLGLAASPLMFSNPLNRTTFGDVSGLGKSGA